MTDAPLPAGPAFDATVLQRLASDLEDEGFAVVFASCYRRMLPGRLARITRSLDDGDVDCALDATLSLKVSCLVVGACQLAELASAIEGDVRRHDLEAARAAARQLAAVADRADHALRAYLEA